MGGCVSRESGGGGTTSSCISVMKARRKGAEKTNRLCGDDANGVVNASTHRICCNGSSTFASLYTLQGRKGINQDSMIVWEDFMSENTVFCGVFDGHGPYGHLVSRAVRDSLPRKLQDFWNSLETNGKKSRSSKLFRKNKKFKRDFRADDGVHEHELFSAWKDAYMKAFRFMDKELRGHEKIDCFCSGSTAVAIVKQGDYLFIGNVGDSRAILATKADDDSLVPVQLTVDLKPDLPRETERILKCRGRVFALQDEPDVHRVWLPNDDAPGLAMARAFGDFCLKDYGVISVPEVSYRLLNDRDQFVVLASDGVWDVLSNEEVVKIVSSAHTRSMAASMVVQAAVGEWKAQFPTSKMDDCAVVCLYLDTADEISSIGGSSELFDEHTEVSDDGPSLHRLDTIRNSKCSKSMMASEPYKDMYSEEYDTLDSCISVDDTNQSWSGLEGVTRVNTLLHLPRFPEKNQGRRKQTTIS